MSFEFVSIFGFRILVLPLRLAPWNTDSTKIELFARSAIPQGESSFIRFPKPKFNGKFQICLVRFCVKEQLKKKGTRSIWGLLRSSLP